MSRNQVLLDLQQWLERGLQQGDTELLVRLMELIKRHIDLSDPDFETALTAKLQSPESAEVLQLWLLAGLAAKQRQGAGTVTQWRANKKPFRLPR